ncbi:hypothetical protein NC661_12260 [Aquibacillus koreensis]|uniref:Lipoprotein n=1 Tax=Aquibacillus koreensis TaxID=279446 RepID=A0A9X3WM50_9BACI|nr:DUF6612 family protein [Aquibacillus koreensis]MCT2537825.1 hypothetical protein [Aquibacillus koreensis]MDC3421143.1 hypothetical protein [Aquibacillus koreensis]
MRKSLLLLSTFIIITVLSACSESERSNAKDIFLNAMESSQEMQSFELQMELEQSFGNEELSNTEGFEAFNMSTDTKMQMEPLAFHQTMDTMGMTIEMYYTPDGVFLQQFEDQWLKASQEQFNELNELIGVSQNMTPVDQLEELEEYVEDFSIEENADHYVLTVDAKDIDMEEILKSQLGENIPTDELTDEMMESVSVNNLHYTISIEKETYYPTSLVIDMNVVIEEDGQETTIVQKVDATYSNYNEVDEIIVPEEVQSNAVEM